MDWTFILLLMTYGCASTVSSNQCPESIRNKLALAECLKQYKSSEDFLGKDQHIIQCKETGELVACIKAIDSDDGCNVDATQREAMEKITESATEKYGGKNCPYTEEDYRRVMCEKKSRESLDTCNVGEIPRKSSEEEEDADYGEFCNKVRCYEARMRKDRCDFDFQEFADSMDKFHKVCGSTAAVFTTSKLLAVLTLIVVSIIV